MVTPLLDARRLSDILLMLVKQRLSGTRVHLMCLHRCDTDSKYSKVLRDAKEMLRELKGVNKKRLVQEERLRSAEQRLDARFGRFHCKLIAMSSREGLAEVMVTSASFHKWHFELENGDTLAHFRLTASELVNNYLAPLGLAHQVILDSGPSSMAELSGGDMSDQNSSVASSQPATPHPPPPASLSLGGRSPTRSNSLSPSSPSSSSGYYHQQRAGLLSPSSQHSRSVPSVAQSPVMSVASTSPHRPRSPSSPMATNHSTLPLPTPPLPPLPPSVAAAES